MITTVLLDRDGVINYDSPQYILSVEAWQPIEGSLEAISAMTQRGIQVGICSNQSALGRGMFQKKDMQAIHQKMLYAIHDQGGYIGHVAYCPHTPNDNCTCRKPLPGLLLETMAKLQAKVSETVMIGDSLRDVEAALAANIEPILVRSGYGDAQEIANRAKHLCPSIVIYDDLVSAISALGFMNKIHLK